MDPDATLDLLIVAATTRDLETFDTAAEALRAWLQGGGFLPQDPRR